MDEEIEHYYRLWAAFRDIVDFGSCQFHAGH